MTQKCLQAARRPVAAAFLLLTAGTYTSAQTAPAAAPVEDAAAASDEVVVLNPFVVSASDSASGYNVKDTLAGTRVRTELKDVASSISVVNAQFLKDIGARNSQDLLVYTTNTEVAGTSGNFSGMGSTFLSGFAQNDFANPSTNTRVRGVDSADNTRDYFTSDIPWDSYIVDRVDLQRGPNSILFGVGSPAGIVNTSTNGASFKTGGKFENRLGSFGSYRTSFDYNEVLLEDQLSFRLSLLDDNTKYRQKPAFNHDRRLFAALRFDPAFLNKEWGKTSIKANVEFGNVRANRPRYTPPEDHITPYFMTEDENGDAINRQSYDSLLLWQSGYAGVTGSSNTDSNVNYWIGQYKGPGMQTTNNAVALYPTGSSGTVESYVQALPVGKYVAGGKDWGVPYYATMGIVGYSDYAKAADLAGSDAGVWKSYSLTDTSIYDFYNNLIDGSNKKEWQKWNAINVTLEQMLFNNRLAFQLVYDRQDYTEGQERNLNNPYISVDINEYVGTSAIWDDTATVNPYAGYAFVGSGTRDSGGSSRDSLRESLRATVTGELRASDFLDKSSWLARALGRHVFTGLYDHNTTTVRNLSWARYAYGTDYTDAIGLSEKSKLTDGSRVLDWITYLGYVGDLTSASGANLAGITAVQSPSGTVSVTYWDPTYNATSDAWAQEWTNPYASYSWSSAWNSGTWNSSSGAANYANPDNYVGWTTGEFTILNADEGDRDLLYTTASKLRTKIESKAITWQGYFWDDTIVPTWGYRRDKVVNDSGYGTTDETTGSILDYDTIAYNSDYRDVSEASSVSWGVVLHMPKALRGKLPWGTDVSLHYNKGQNTRSEIRYGFDGQRLPNASGKTEEYGFTLSTLNDKLQFKTTWYETNVKNANMASTTGQNGTLGSNTYYMYLLPTWGTAHALVARAGLAGELSSYDSDGNWIAGSNSAQGVWDWTGASGSNDTLTTNVWWPGNDPLSAEYQADPLAQIEAAAVADWFTSMNMGQDWYDAYGFDVDATAWSNGDWSVILGEGFDISNPNIGGVQASGSGKIRGTYPIGTCDTRSTGVEMEMTAQPFKGMSVSLNASRTFASQTQLSPEFVAAITDMYDRLVNTNAGDMRLWWAGDPTTIGQLFVANIWAPYQFQVQTNGKMASEMSQWRFNAVVNYSFDEGLFNGKLKGLNVGAGYRWQKAPVIGYLMTDSTDADWIAANLDTMSNLDVNLPVYGEGEADLDLWIGYNKQLTDKINWNIQLNVRSVGKKAHLQAISVQPLLNSDGSYDYANYRIKDGMTWSLTNTFSF